MKTHYIAQILAAGVLWAGTALADIVWSGEQNLTVDYSWLYIDLNSDSLTDAMVWYQVFVDDASYIGGTSGVLRVYTQNWGLDGANQILVDASNSQNSALPYGTLISGSPDSSLEWKSGLYASGRVSLWSNSSPEPETEWSGMLGETGEAYQGIAFDIEGSTHYGWIHVTLGEVDPNYGLESPIIASWAYESTPDTPIIAGVIPEPSTGILTMVGSVGLLFVARSRRRR
jgi:hypothetical protein